MEYSGKLKPLELNANRLLPIRLPPEPWEPFQPTEAKQNKRERVNAPSIENTSTALPTLPKTSENTADLRLTTFENLPPIMDPTSPFINAFPFNNTGSLSPPIISTNQPYVNFPPVKFSSITNYFYSNDNTLLPTRSTFVFPSSEQIASDIIHFLVQASSQTSPNNLRLFVFENMLNKHYKQSLISHIDLLLLTFPNRNYSTLESIIRSCITEFDFR